MANTNDYANPWATGSGANVLTAAQLAALATRLTGFGQGNASSQQANTIWRQVTVAVAALTQLAADYGPGNVVDDGNVANLENQILSAIRNATAVSQAPGIPYEGQDTGSTNNSVFVATTVPSSGALAAGQIFVVTKNNQVNTGAVTFKNGANAAVAVNWPDGTPLNPGDWPPGGSAVLYVVSQSGVLSAQFMTAPRLNFPGLTELDTPGASDPFAFYSIAQQQHVKIPFSTLAALITPLVPPQTPTGVLNIFTATSNSTTAASGQNYNPLGGWGGITSTFATGAFNGSVFSVPTAGYYDISAGFDYRSQLVAGASVWIWVNGQPTPIRNSVGDFNAPTNAEGGVCCSGKLYLNAGSTIQVNQVFGSSGGASRSLQYAHFSVTQLHA